MSSLYIECPSERTGLCSKENTFKDGSLRGNCASLRLQGLQAKWRRKTFRKPCTGDYRGASALCKCGRMRLSRRMWLWTKYGRRWQDIQQYSRTRSDSTSSWFIRALVLFIAMAAVGSVEGWTVSRNSWSSVPKLCMRDAAEAEQPEEIFGDAGILLDDLTWRVEKLRLEEQNVKRFLKAKPRFLPYEECRKWVHAFNRWNSEEDWKNWIAMGEKRNSYIPSRPDEYYTQLGDWISWDHFLGVESKDNTTSTSIT